MRHVCGFALALALGGGCTPAAHTMAPSHVAAIADSVRHALGDYARYGARAEWDSVVRLYTADTSYRWIEDGRRYRLTDTRGALGRLGSLRVLTTYDSTDVQVLAPGLAALTTYYHTEFEGATPPVRFGGAISMVWAHEPEGWRIWNGHSSSQTPHAERAAAR